MMRWRVLSPDDVWKGQTRGAVAVRRTPHATEHCILEQWDEFKMCWEPVPLVWPPRA